MDAFQPITIVGIASAELSAPRRDGTAGSALYAVPIRLSRPAPTGWAELFEQTWDHPPSFTTAHRPGICRVSGDRIVLERTTLDEIEHDHKETLKTVLDLVNGRFAAIESEGRMRSAERQSKTQSLTDELRERAKQIRFD